MKTGLVQQTNPLQHQERDRDELSLSLGTKYCGPNTDQRAIFFTQNSIDTVFITFLLGFQHSCLFYIVSQTPFFGTGVFDELLVLICRFEKVCF